jgi:hypothetical protein
MDEEYRYITSHQITYKSPHLRGSCQDTTIKETMIGKVEEATMMKMVMAAAAW